LFDKEINMPRANIDVDIGPLVGLLKDAFESPQTKKMRQLVNARMMEKQLDLGALPPEQQEAYAPLFQYKPGLIDRIKGAKSEMMIPPFSQTTKNPTTGAVTPGRFFEPPKPTYHFGPPGQEMWQTNQRGGPPKLVQKGTPTAKPWHPGSKEEAEDFEKYKMGLKPTQPLTYRPQTREEALSFEREKAGIKPPGPYHPTTQEAWKSDETFKAGLHPKESEDSKLEAFQNREDIRGEHRDKASQITNSRIEMRQAENTAKTLYAKFISEVNNGLRSKESHMEFSDWLLLHPEGKIANQAINEAKGRLHYYTTGTIYKPSPLVGRGTQTAPPPLLHPGETGEEQPQEEHLGDLSQEEVQYATKRRDAGVDFETVKKEIIQRRHGKPPKVRGK
jgi:hypothetical protein